jgi:hypothetical protein
LQLDWTCQNDGFEVCWYGLHLQSWFAAQLPRSWWLY